MTRLPKWRQLLEVTDVLEGVLTGACLAGNGIIVKDCHVAARLAGDPQRIHRQPM
jgi:hypothetical protein